jgi:transcriptional regulator with XRE-family HTH domain
MPRSISIDALPSSVKLTLEQLGSHIRRARIRRAIRATDLAARCLLTLPTLRKVERGDPTVSLGALMAVLWALGMQDRLGGLLERDPIGEELEERRMRQRVHLKAKDDF